MNLISIINRLNWEKFANGAWGRMTWILLFLWFIVSVPVMLGDFYLLGWYLEWYLTLLGLIVVLLGFPPAMIMLFGGYFILREVFRK